MERYRLLQPHLEEGVPLARIAREQGIVLRTAQRWLRRYRDDGLAGLVRRPRPDRGIRSFPADLVRLVEGLALQVPAQSVAAVHRRVVAVAAEQGWPAPSYGTVYAIARRLHPGLAFSPDDDTDAEALAAIARITGGNFRLVQRLFAQIERVLRINEVRTITAEVIEAARESLVIGPLG